MAEVGFSEYEEELLRFLATKYDEESEFVRVDELPDYDKLGREAVWEVVERLRRHGLVKRYTNVTIEILESLLTTVHQLDNPPIPNYWKELFSWWVKSKWRVGITAFVVILPLLVQWVEMVKTVLSWIGVLSSG